MVQTLKRSILLVAAVAVVGGVASSVALAAAPGHGRLAARMAARGGFLPFAAPRFGFGLRGPGFGLGGPGFPGGRGPHGGPGILAADVLTPAASFLGISVSALQSDLKGGKTLAQEATAKGKTAAALVDAIVASEKTVLDGENAAGWITDAQETSLLDDLKEQIAALVDNGPPVPPVRRAGLLDTAATYLGISVADLQADLKSGKSLADEATAKGKTADGLVSALTAQAKTNLDAQVTAGEITAAQEQTILADVTKHMTDLVDNAKFGSKSMTRMRVRFRH